MTNYRIIIAIVLLAVLISCDNYRDQEKLYGTWINSNLDHVTFTNNQIEIGYGFAMSSQTFSYQLSEDSIMIPKSASFGDPNDHFRIQCAYQFIDSFTLVFSSNQTGGFFGRSVSNLDRFVKSDILLHVHPWDSLIQYKYIPVVYGTSENMMEKLKISSDGGVALSTSLIDTLANATFVGDLTHASEWLMIREQVSYIDTSYFHLFQSEVSDGYLLEIELYQSNRVLRFSGYDLPMLFPELHNFLCCAYAELKYRH